MVTFNTFTFMDIQIVVRLIEQEKYENNKRTAVYLSYVNKNGQLH